MLRYLELYATLSRTFGLRLRPLRTFGLFQINRVLNVTTRGLDHLFFPAIREVAIKRPIFILGNPRGGTTFLHRFLLNSGDLCAMELWEMLFPAITARKALGGLVDRLAPISPARYHGAAAHETSLRDVETDDAADFLHTADGAFLWSYYLAWADEFGSELCRRYTDLGADPRREARFFRYMEGCWRRNMVSKGRDRILVKSFSLTPQAARLLERYPDARLLYIVRDPVDTIPSGISLVTGVLERSFDMWNSTSPEARQRYLENLYQGACQLYRSFYDLRRSGALPEGSTLVVPYPSMMRDLEGTMERIVDFAGLNPVDGFWDTVREQAERQRTHRSKHSYALDRFGLTEERIRSDLAFVYEAYDLS